MDTIPWELATQISSQLGSFLFLAKLTCHAWNKALFVDKHGRKSSRNVRIYRDAAGIGSIEIIKWLLKRYPRRYQHNALFELAAMKGHVELLVYLKDNLVPYDCPITLGTIAAGAGHLNVVEWLHSAYEKQLQEHDNDIMEYAVRGGNIDVIKWLVDNGYKINAEPCYTIAIIRGHNIIVKWLITNNYAINYKVMLTMAGFGRPDTAQILWEHNSSACTSCSYKEIESAARTGNIPMLEWLFDHGYYVPNNIISKAHDQKTEEWLRQRLGS